MNTLFTTSVDQSDEYGGRYTTYSLVQFPSGTPADAVEIHIKDDFVAYRCEHEYDCCGNYYPGSPHWVKLAESLNDSECDEYLVTQGWTQNV